MPVIVSSELQGTIVGVFVEVGSVVRAGSVVALVESMKMHHDVLAPSEGTIEAVDIAEGATVVVGQPLMRLVEGSAGPEGPNDADSEMARPKSPIGLERGDLSDVIARHTLGLDAQRPEAVAKRRARGRRTTRENVADLVDEGSFVEYGPVVIAAQRRRRELDDLIASTPADGLVGGLGDVNGELFGDDSAGSQSAGGRAAKCVVVSYDYTVLAGTQGTQNHRKKDRLFEVAEQLRLPSSEAARWMCRTRRLRHVKIGKRLLVRRSWIDEFVEREAVNVFGSDH